jgi:signal transduction histidine kinase
MWYDLDHMKFRFIDQGCGISEERMKSISEPFYSTKEKGTGLGLMISYKIVQEHGGTINIKSIVNKGTTVEVILPIKQSRGVLT